MTTFLFDNIHRLFSGDGEELFDRIYKTLIDYNMVKKIENGVLVGFSGGKDSVMLISFLLEYRYRRDITFDIVACHVNHMIRGDEAERDLTFSEQMCRSLNVPFVSYNIDVPKIAKESGLGIEEAARKARYSAFDKVLSQNNSLHSIAVAHNSTDNLETVIFNMMRGSGLSGACGISAVRDNVIRPLIRIPKSDISRYLDSVGIPYVTDSTNLETEYTRNYIRHEIYPRLEHLTSSPETMVTRFTESLREVNDYLNSVSLSALSSVLNDDEISSDSLLLMDPAVRSRVISLFVERFTGLIPENKHINLITEALPRDNTSLSLHGGYSFVIQRRKCRILPIDFFIPDERVQPIKLGLNKLLDYDAFLYLGNDENYSYSKSEFTPLAKTTVSYDSLVGELSVRFKRDGDSYRYGGMTHKLKKVFNDRNIPTFERSRIPVVCDGQGIVWVPGLPPRDGDNKDNKKVSMILLARNSEKRISTAKQR